MLKSSSQILLIHLIKRIHHEKENTIVLSSHVLHFIFTKTRFFLLLLRRVFHHVIQRTHFFCCHFMAFTFFLIKRLCFSVVSVSYVNALHTNKMEHFHDNYSTILTTNVNKNCIIHPATKRTSAAIIVLSHMLTKILSSLSPNLMFLFFLKYTTVIYKKRHLNHVNYYFKLDLFRRNKSFFHHSKN